LDNSTIKKLKTHLPKHFQKPLISNTFTQKLKFNQQFNKYTQKSSIPCPKNVKPRANEQEAKHIYLQAMMILSAEWKKGNESTSLCPKLPWFLYIAKIGITDCLP